jgi:hypothetical protein
VWKEQISAVALFVYERRQESGRDHREEGHWTLNITVGS